MVDQTPLQDILKSPIERADLQTFIRDEISAKNEYITELYKNYYMYGNDRWAELSKDDEKRRTNIVSPITNMFQTKLYNMVKEADKRFTAMNKNPNISDEVAKKRSKESLDWMYYAFWKEETIAAFNSATFDAGLIWRWVFKTWYRYVKYTRKYMDKEWKWDKTIEVKLDYPVLTYVSPYNIYIDPAAKTLTEARFVAERKLINDAEINRQYGIYGIKVEWATIKELDWLTSNWTTEKDFESIKKNMPFYGTSMTRDITADTTYNIKWETREVIEVHTKNSITIYINGKDMWTFAQLWPVEGYRYKIINFKENPWTIYSIGTWYIVRPLQEVYDSITNLRIDNVKLIVNKSFFVESTLNFMWNSKRMKILPWGIHKVQNLQGIKEIDMSEMKESAYRETDTMFQLCQWATWVSNYWLGMQNKVERVSWAVDMLQGALDSWAKPLVDSIRKNMAEVMKEFLALTIAYTDQDELDKVLWEWNTLKNIKAEDISDDYVFDFNLESQKNKDEAIIRQQLLDLIKLAPVFIDKKTQQTLFNMKDILTRLWDSFGLDSDLITEEQMDNMWIDMNALQNMQWGWQTPTQLGRQMQTWGMWLPSWVPATNEQWVNA